MISSSIIDDLRALAKRRSSSPERLLRQWITQAEAEDTGGAEAGSQPLERELLENIQEGIFLLGSENRFEHINARPSEVSGADLTTLIGAPIDRLFTGHDGPPEAYLEPLKVAIRRVRERDREEQRIEIPVRTPAGDTIHIEVRIALLRSTGDKVVLVTRDITDRIQSKRRFRERETRLEGLAHSIPGVVYQVLVRPDGTYGNNFVSEQARELLGLDPDAENFYERFVERVPSSHREALIASIDEAAEQERRWEFETPFKKPGGERIWLRGISMPDTRAEELVFNGVLLDIAERKRREQALRRAEHQFQAIFEDPHMLVGILDVDGTLRAVNETALSYVQTSREEVCGQPFWECPWFAKSQKAQVRNWIERAREGEYVHFEISLRGTLADREVEGTVRPVTNGTGEVVALVISDRDVTERNEYEWDLVRAKEEAEQASRVKSALLENMSHEFRTPLASVLGFADLLAEETEGRIQQFAERIREGGTRLQETLEAVLNLAQLEGEGLEIEPQEIDAAEAIRQAAEAQEPKAQRKGLTVRSEGTDRPVRARTDPSVLTRITTHLVSNGIKFTEDGMVEVVLTSSEGTLVLEVRDTGTGISDETREDIFEPFFQASSGLSREYEGSGLGLTITRHLVEEAGGTIDLDSDEQGTTVTVALPRDLSGREAQGSASPDPAGNLDPLPASLRMLLIEDDASMRELVREMLPDATDLSVAAGPEEALTEIRADSFDVILLDINLKAATNGVDLLAHIRSEAEPPGPLVIAMTAYATAGDEESFRAEGFDGYLPKPFNEETLRENISQVLEEKR